MQYNTKQLCMQVKIKNNISYVHVKKDIDTRLHSSRMRTARTLTVSPSMLCSGGVPGPGVYLVPGSLGVYLVLGGVPGPGGCTWSGGCVCLLWGVPGPGGCTWSPGGVPGPGGVSALRGCTWSGGMYLVPGGSAPGEGVSAQGVPGQVLPPTL